MSARAGDTLAGRYRLVEQLGSGGFGEIWKATDELLGMEVALKVFWERDAARKERYLREARALARYAGDLGVVGIRDLVETEDCVMLVMEHLAGQDLQAYLTEQGRLTLAETMRIIAPIARVVSRMHADGLLHRDISPDNIRVLPDGSARLFDFGSVGGSVATSTITVKPGYAPPEQYATPDQQGPWTDVYALAATMYQCIVGRAPVDSLQRTFHDELELPSQAGASVPPEVDNAFMKALEPDYRKRTGAVADFMAALEAGMAHEEALAVDSGEPITSHDRIVSDKRVEAHDGQATPHDKGEFPDAEAPSKTTAPRIPDKAAEPRGEARAKKPDAKAKGGKPGFGGGKARLAIAVVVVLVFLIGGLFAIRSCTTEGSAPSTAYRTGSSTTSYVKGETISATTLDALAADEKTQIVDLRRCALDDEAVRRLSEIDHIVGVQLTECTGFTTLEPLQTSDYVTRISLNKLDEFDCAVMLPAKAPNATFLQMRYLRVENAGGLLEKFPALTQLSLIELQGLDDVSALSKMPDLEEVELVGFDLSNDRSEALASHPKLRSVEAPASGMDSMSWASTCPELGTLCLDGNEIGDISALASCEKLDHVSLNGNVISDLAPLKESSKTLFSLQIAGNKIKSLDALARASRLDTLQASENAISSIAALDGCTNLAYVDLSGNDIADASPLMACEGMKRLSLARNRITNLDFCERMIKLTHIDVSFNRIADMDKIASCSSAEQVCLQDNQIADISALGNGFVSLELLNIANNKVKSLEPLENCGSLCRLGAYSNEISSLKGLENKPNLWVLLADNNRISDISALGSSNQHLEYVDLGHNEVSDISALAGLFSSGVTPGKYGISGGGVAVLLDNNKVSGVDSLPVRDDYRILALHGNPIGDVGHLAQKDVKWSSLYLPYVEGADYSAFNAYLNVDMNFVDVPFDKQAEVLRASLKAVDPDFLTAEEADAELAAYRKELYKNVSGEEDESDSGESSEHADDGLDESAAASGGSPSSSSSSAVKSGGVNG